MHTDAGLAIEEVIIATTRCGLAARVSAHYPQRVVLCCNTRHLAAHLKLHCLLGAGGRLGSSAEVDPSISEECIQGAEHPGRRLSHEL